MKMSYFEWLHKKDACRFYGGPLHGEIIKMQPWQTEYHVHVADFVPMSTMGKTIPSRAPYRIAIYKFEYDTTIVWPKPWPPERRFCFVFTEIR